MHEELRLDNQLCFKIYSASRLIGQAYRQLLEPLGLTYPQYLVMLVLWEQDNLTVGEIGQRLMLDTNTLTPLLQRMENDGLIVRTRGIADGRKTLVSLNKKGRRLEEQARELPASLTALWQDGSVNEEQLRNLTAVLDTISERLR